MSSPGIPRNRRDAERLLDDPSAAVGFLRPVLQAVRIPGQAAELGHEQEAAQAFRLARSTSSPAARAVMSPTPRGHQPPWRRRAP